MQSSKRNMERMAEVVPDTNEQSFQHFLSNSFWNPQAVMAQVAQDTDALLGGSDNSALYIDESCFKKQGKKSVGVARQWNGRLGKVDNSQCGVFAALGKGDRVGIVDARLYLPQEWTDHAERCEKAQVPLERRQHKSKLDIALEMVFHARSQGLRFSWVGVDSFYGQAPHLLRGLDRAGEIFVADVHSDQRIYQSDPNPYIPTSDHHKGRKRSKLQTDQPSIQVAHWAKQQPASAWKRKTLRDTSQGKLMIEVLCERVWLWDKKERHAHEWHLIVRRELNSPETIKYSLSNADANISTLKLARMQAQRFWIERAFQDAKSNSGMADYQARNWYAWHRHIALVMLAMQFMLSQRLHMKDDVPLLSCRDIQELLAITLPNRQLSEDDVAMIIEARHRKRQLAIESAARCQKEKIKSKKMNE
jgi:SRSO17 transposase